MNAMGHNENAIRLAALAGDAQIALDRVAKGEADAFDGWLAYGAALNEGRALFPSDEQFGQWVVSSNLRLSDNDKMERAAAMWAASNSDQLSEAKAASDARTPRGLHKKWLEIKADREKAQRDEEQRQKAEAERKAAQERAEAARKQAAESAAAEAEARKAADEAKDEAEREAAEKRAHDAAKARAEAEQEVELAEADPEPETDPHAEARKCLSGLTREGLEDEVIGLREENTDLRAKLKEAKAERDEFKSRWKEATEQEMGRALGNAQRQRDTAKGRLGEELAKNSRQGRRIRILEGELAEAKRALEMQEITL